MGEFEARAPVAPLLAYTASKQKDLKDRKGKSKATSRVKPGVSKVYKATSVAHSRPRAHRAEKKIEFDESARREYLTGFHKRKQARIEKGREKAKERSKLEMKQMRVELRESRKKQAAENVAAEKQAYGDADGEGEGEEEDDNDLLADGSDNEEKEALPSAFDTEQHHTTITIQEFDPNEPEKESQEAPKQRKIIKESLPPSSRRIAKKLKNNKELAGAREISKLMDNEENLLHVDEELLDAKEEKVAKEQSEGIPRPFSKVRKGKFRYESKLDRAKAKSQARETKAKWAEKRREERNASGPKGRMQKNKGKRGLGSKGTKKK